MFTACLASEFAAFPEAGLPTAADPALLVTRFPVRPFPGASSSDPDGAEFMRFGAVSPIAMPVPSCSPIGMPAFAEGPIPSPLPAVSPTALPGEAASGRVDEVAAALISGGLSREASTPNEGKAAKLDGALAANSLARTKAASGTAGTDTNICSMPRSPGS